MGRHPARAVFDVDRAQGKDLAGADSGAEQDLERVTDLTVGLRAGGARRHPPRPGRMPDRGHLIQGECLG
ncbi:hypothetical protein GCM10009788_25880 [Nocardioides humi]|uniref:Uncharacterized protein n=1 Tax=Nocardioides humi TaxID=449461 RepID=A0ABN2AK16_9ACTN